jgi:hypothetical protein
VDYMPVAAWFIYSGIYSSGGLVYIKWDICQWRPGLYMLEYIPVAAWFIHNGISDSGVLEQDVSEKKL